MILGHCIGENTCFDLWKWHTTTRMDAWFKHASLDACEFLAGTNQPPVITKHFKILDIIGHGVKTTCVRKTI